MAFWIFSERSRSVNKMFDMRKPCNGSNIKIQQCKARPEVSSRIVLFFSINVCASAKPMRSGGSDDLIAGGCVGVEPEQIKPARYAQ
jgi:hypothetical protein